jgi:hypothetical protein
MLRDLKSGPQEDAAIDTGPVGQEDRMTKAKMFGGALVGAALALTGCAGADTSASAGALDTSVVSGDIDGRTDLFVDRMLSTHLLTADEVNGSPTAVAVEVQLTESELIAWRAQPSLAAADRSRTDADIVARFDIVGSVEGGPVDLSTATAIDNETHPGDPSQVVIPGGQLGGFHGSHSGGSTTHPPLTAPPTTVNFRISWGNNSIPDNVDTDLLHNISVAHPGCG